MPPSGGDPRNPDATGETLAIAAESLYLANLLLLPGISFLVLLGLFLKRREHATPLARNHLEQTLFASLWAGLLLVAVNLCILLLGGYRGPYIWLIVILYFTVCHSSLVLLGMLGLAKALAGRCFRYPLIGRRLPPGCRGAA